jgi:phosphatidylserine decarboxylase|nr:phosphatidylserine decarboxylase [Candidatus Hecatella orcuttiae]
MSTLWVIGLILALVIALFLVNFYRDPERMPPADEGVIVAPADGRIVYVREIERGEILWTQKGGRRIPLKEILWDEDLQMSSGYILGIYMSPFNVHVNRAPIAGRVVKVSKREGKLLRIGREEFEFRNRRNILVLEHETGFRVVVVQIAAFIVGRIDCYVGEGETVNLGQRIGKLNLAPM